jgi:hypothetical protein
MTAAAARAILEHNWRGRSTVPSRTLYPHQWSWDAAFIAVGWAHVDPQRAQLELRSLLRGQWADGRVPHIVFDPGVPEDAYFPAPAFWRSHEVAAAPRGVPTSGITQPPLHAPAALAISRRLPGPHARDFLTALYPGLAAQEGYLARERDAGGGLAAIVHPWESGLDNSPAWDAALDAVALPPGGVEPYERRDLAHADPADRPTDAAYDRYVHLARTYRARGYADAGLTEWSPFLVEDPLFNAVALWASRSLVEIAERIGADPGPHHAHADRLHEALGARLWDPARGGFAVRDLVAGRLVERRTVGCLAPLLDHGLAPERVDALAADLRSERFWRHAGVASYDLTAPDMDPRRYWRGPVWVNTNWLLATGLRLHGRDALAAELDAATLGLVAGAGFREYFDPRTGVGHGSDDFSWSAALVLDILARRPR